MSSPGLGLECNSEQNVVLGLPPTHIHTEEDAPLCIDVERSPIYSKLKKNEINNE